jgi:3-hydroxyacyl-CoA dehydrogenase / enoyl-CoA hydratase / 3-hydroxybutyryl-CoA epimerase
MRRYFAITSRQASKQIDGNRLAVIGSGQMGTGIAIVASKIGNVQVQVVCENEKCAIMCKTFVDGWIDKEIDRKRMTEEERFHMLKNISFSLDISDTRNSDFVIEAVREDIDLKR